MSVFIPSGNKQSPSQHILTPLITPWRKINDSTEQSRAQLAAILSLTLTGLLGIGGIAASVSLNTNAFAQIWVYAPLGAALSAYFLSRMGYTTQGSFILVTGLCATAYISIATGIINSQTAFFYFIPLALILGNALLSEWTLFLVLGLNAGTTIFVLPNYGFAFNEQAAANLGIITTLGVSLILLGNYQRKSEREQKNELQKINKLLEEARQNLENRVEERTQELNRRSVQLEASTLVARSAAMVRSLGELLESVVEQITERFGYYHAGIFLTDPAEKFVILQAASSEGGRQLLKRGFKVDIGRQGIVGYAAYQKRPRIVQDVAADLSYIHIPELSETRSEVALPLIVRNRVIGVLDIQSEESNAFKFDDIYTLQTMADQVALAIDNAILLEESRAALQQLESVNASSAANAWKTRLQEGPRGFTYTPLGLAPLASRGGSEPAEGQKIISIPLNLRGKSIGTISLKRKANDPNWVEAEREMAARIASQVALAVENARLLEESQRRAAREQKVSEFSSRFSRSLDVDALLQNAARELHSLPQVEEISVLINPAKTTDPVK